MELLNKVGHLAAGVRVNTGEGGAYRALIDNSLESLLTSGGDGRLDPSRSGRRNSYGCTPYFRHGVIDFASSTASSISEQAYERAADFRNELWAASAICGYEQALEEAVENARSRLRHYLDVKNCDIVFSPSGTDSQLQALFLVKLLYPCPLTTVIVGADQTGSGTAHTARGEHFSARTALGVQVRKGTPIAELAGGLTTVPIGFCKPGGELRSLAQIDEAVYQAVSDAIAGGSRVLLQIMDSSKLGWKAPSESCVSQIAKAWPDKVIVVVDACQMRLSGERLRRYLASGYLVLITGSKFFTGPAFSGALLVPCRLARPASLVRPAETGMADYCSRFDWPLGWAMLRSSFAPTPNYGQWLRWEAALEEMRAYFSVPLDFRDQVLAEFGTQLGEMIASCGQLALLERPRDQEEHDAEFRNQTIFSVVARLPKRSFSIDDYRNLYHAMAEDMSGLLPDAYPGECGDSCAILCQIGQPVALHHRDGAVLRLSASARLVSSCWARGASGISQALAPEMTRLRTAIAKLAWLVAHRELLQVARP